MVSTSDVELGFCFSFLEDSEKEILSRKMEQITYDAGEYVYHEGDKARGLFLLCRGRVAVLKKTGFGERRQVVALLDPGAPIGERGVLTGEKLRESTLTAIEESELFFLSQVSFEELLAEHTIVAAKLLRYLLGIASLRLSKSSERLAHVL